MIYVLLADGFEEIEALTPVDVLRRAGLPLATVGIGESRVICGSHGIRVTADLSAAEATKPIDMLILPGGMPGADHLDASPDADALIQRAVHEDAPIGAICAAPFLLGRRGLLRGKRAVCFPGFESRLEGATVLKNTRVVTDGRITTAVGMGAAGEFALALLAVLRGEEEAARIRDSAFLHA